MKHSVQIALCAAFGMLSSMGSLAAQTADRSYYGIGDASGNRISLSDENGQRLAFWDGKHLWSGDRAFRIERGESALQLVSIDKGEIFGQWTHWSKYFQMGPGMEYFRLSASGNPEQEKKMCFKRSSPESGTLELLYRVDGSGSFFEIHGARNTREALYFFAVMIDQVVAQRTI
jgi:hypothetical protein